MHSADGLSSFRNDDRGSVGAMLLVSRPCLLLAGMIPAPGPRQSLVMYSGEPVPPVAVGLLDSRAVPPGTVYADALNGITCVSVTVCYAVGTAGTILSTSDEGRTWSNQSNPIRGNRLIDLYGVACPSRSVCYAVGGHGSMLKTADSGRTWREQRTPLTGTSRGLFRVSCPRVDICHAVGRSSVLASRNGGRTWDRELSSGNNYTFTDVACPDRNVCYVSGFDSLIATTTDGGRSWHRRTIYAAGGTAPLLGIACPGVRVCSVVGDAGTVLTTLDGGSAWSDHQLGRHVTLLSIACPNRLVCYAVAVGQRGKILRTVDGSRSWVSVGDHTPSNGVYLQGIACPTARECFAVGFAYSPRTKRSSYAVFVTRNGGDFWTSGSPRGAWSLRALVPLSADGSYS